MQMVLLIPSSALLTAISENRRPSNERIIIGSPYRDVSVSPERDVSVSPERDENITLRHNSFKMEDATAKHSKSQLFHSHRLSSCKRRSIASSNMTTNREIRTKEENHDDGRKGIVKTEATKRAMKSEASGKRNQKKPRISEAVVKEAATKMLEVLIRNYKDEITEVPVDILASSIKSRAGKPYKNPRSDAIVMGLKNLKKENKAECNNGIVVLSQSEIIKIPKDDIGTKDPSQLLELRFQQFLERLASNPKGGSGETVTSAARKVWEKLSDGEAYSRKQLVTVTSYKGTNSSGFEAIMKVLYELKFVDGKGQCSFTKKVLPRT